MFIGGHIMIFSKDAEADRAFLRDIVKLPHVDAGEGWLIFALNGAEVGVHPGEQNDVQHFYLMTDDLDGEIARLAKAGVTCTDVQTQGWGRSTSIPLPGGGKLPLYQPRHPSAIMAR
jgi:catechol 2,3-dioxygenase-like lactoylglutathione lyase family enzyme